MKNGLLLGAGFSYDLGMPLTYELTEIFLGIFNNDRVKKLSLFLSSQQPFGNERPINEKAINAGLNLLLEYKKDQGNNYEAFLASLESLNGISNPNQSDKDSYHFLFGMFYEIIHLILSLYQQASYEILYKKNREWFSRLEDLLSEHETWVFTLNHDLFFEYLALDFNIPLTYGGNKTIVFPVNNLDLNKKIEFSVIERKNYNINNDSFYKEARGINLIKLHGGLSELEYKDNTLLCNLKLDKKSSQELANEFSLFNEMAYFHAGKKVSGGKDRIITDLNGELDVISKSMLTGGRKYSETSKIKEGEEKVKIFDDALNRLDELTVIGYGFGDRHINFRISNALLLNQHLNIVIVDPNALKNGTPDCIKQFDYDLRIKKSACGAAHWMSYCKSKKWDQKQMMALKENVKDRSEVRAHVQNQLNEIFGIGILEMV